MKASLKARACRPFILTDAGHQPGAVAPVDRPRRFSSRPTSVVSDAWPHIPALAPEPDATYGRSARRRIIAGRAARACDELVRRLANGRRRRTQCGFEGDLLGFPRSGRRRARLGWAFVHAPVEEETRSYLVDLHISLGLTAAILVLVQLLLHVALFAFGAAKGRRDGSNALSLRCACSCISPSSR